VCDFYLFPEAMKKKLIWILTNLYKASTQQEQQQE
jgi:hypothetical protein